MAVKHQVETQWKVDTVIFTNLNVSVITSPQSYPCLLVLYAKLLLVTLKFHFVLNAWPHYLFLISEQPSLCVFFLTAL